jgi:hypothetical protein
LQQKFHKGLPGSFQKLLTDIDAAAVRHTEGGSLKIGSILHIDDRATSADKKARVLFERLGERFEALARSKRFAAFYSYLYSPFFWVLGRNAPRRAGWIQQVFPTG